MVRKLFASKVERKAEKVVKEYLKNLGREINIKRAIAFGSFARGDMRRDSDIDLIIISPDFEKMEFMDRLIFLNRMRRGVKRSAPMDILGYTEKEFKRLSKESIVLQGAKKEGRVLIKT